MNAENANFINDKMVLLLNSRICRYFALRFKVPEFELSHMIEALGLNRRLSACRTGTVFFLELYVKREL